MKLLTVAFFILLTFPPVELEERSLLNDTIELLVPKTFKVMTKEMLGKKYPATYLNIDNQPTIVLTDDSAIVYLAFNYSKQSIKDDFKREAIIRAKNAFKIGFQEAFTNAILIDDGIKSIDRKAVGYIKFITEVAGQKMYNYFFLTYVRRKLVYCSFSCPEKLQPEWEETAERIVNSLKVK